MNDIIAWIDDGVHKILSASERLTCVDHSDILTRPFPSSLFPMIRSALKSSRFTSKSAVRVILPTSISKHWSTFAAHMNSTIIKVDGVDQTNVEQFAPVLEKFLSAYEQKPDEVAFEAWLAAQLLNASHDAGIDANGLGNTALSAGLNLALGYANGDDISKFSTLKKSLTGSSDDEIKKLELSEDRCRPRRVDVQFRSRGRHSARRIGRRLAWTFRRHQDCSDRPTRHRNHKAHRKRGRRLRLECCQIQIQIHRQHRYCSS